VFCVVVIDIFDHVICFANHKLEIPSYGNLRNTHCNTHTCISSSVTPKSADNYIAVYIGVVAFVVTALVAVIVVATLR
jgi:hypothetical protein